MQENRDLQDIIWNDGPICEFKNCFMTKSVCIFLIAVGRSGCGNTLQPLTDKV